MPKEPATLATPDPTAARLAALKALYPDALADGKFDFDKLRGLLGDAVAPGPERFTFSWSGRQNAADVLQAPSRAALVPQPADSVNWDATRNLFIEGDNLEVLKLLYKPYAGKVKLIYIDPPYNTGQDFVYPDDFADPLAVYLKLTGQADEAGKLLTGNPETSGRYHSAWLSMMYPRLFLARQLLRDDGVIFVSIDDHEVHHLRLLMNEVFGEENFVASIVVQSNKRGQTYKDISKTHEYLLVYGRSEAPEIKELPKGDDALPFTDSKGPFDLWELRNRNPKFGKHNRPNLFFPIYIAPSLTDENGNAKVSLAPSNQFTVETVLPLLNLEIDERG
ncbi:MAG: site-specific DNA-methyltransferase [Gemmataceae bacterium]